jgi:hypothetical protein
VGGQKSAAYLEKTLFSVRRLLYVAGFPIHYPFCSIEPGHSADEGSEGSYRSQMASEQDYC